MPGIFGVVDLIADANRLDAERVGIVAQMATAMRYDREYAVDVVSCPELGACAGWAGWPQLASRQGIHTEGSQSALVAAGEPDDEPARIVGHLRQHGPQGLGRVKGLFSGFFIDPQRGESTLFTDRYGVERVFLHRRGSRVFFASEAKAILAVAESARAIDETGLAEWLTCGCTLGARSLYRNVGVLEYGTAVTLSPARIPSVTRYFDRANFEQLPALGQDEFVESFHAAFRAAVNEALTRRPAAALSLTGGLDSRLVLGCADVAPQTLPCYTFGSMLRTTGDVAVARAIAAACDQPHRELKLDAGFLVNAEEQLRQAVYVSDGYLGLPGSTELYLNRQARAIAPVRVTGNWGGELMRGVRAFKFRLPKGDFLSPSIRASIDQAHRTFTDEAPAHPLSFTLFQQAPNQGFGRYAIERSQVLMRSPFLSEDVVRSLYQAPLATRASTDLVERLLASRRRLISLPTDIGRLGRGPRALRAARHAYRRAIVKAEYLTSHGAPDWMAALSAHVPLLETVFLGRDKFQHFRLWMRGPLATMVREILTGDGRASLEPWFDTGRVAAMVDDHVAGRANYTDEIDRLLTVALVQRTLLSTVDRGEVTAIPHRVVSAAAPTSA